MISSSTATKIPSRTGAEKKTVGLAREITQGLGSTVVLEAKSGEPSELHPLAPWAPWAPWAPCRVEVERLSRKSGGYHFNSHLLFGGTSTVHQPGCQAKSGVDKQ